MQFITKNSSETEIVGNSVITMPNSLYSNKIFIKDFDVDGCECGNALIELWNNQHPLINTWLILTTLSICFLPVLLLTIH